jgi:hypothetical protein
MIGKPERKRNRAKSFNGRIQMAVDAKQEPNNTRSRAAGTNAGGSPRTARSPARRPFAEILGAIEDHRNWIDSDRARTLGKATEVAGRLLAYGAYLALAYWGYTSWLGIRGALAMGTGLPAAGIGDSRLALFYILAAGLLAPLLLIGIYIGGGWIYNTMVAKAHRALPRFAGPMIHPSLLLVAAAILGFCQTTVLSQIATGCRFAKATVVAASGHKVAATHALDRVNNSVNTDLLSDREKELLRVRAAIIGHYSCLNEEQDAAGGSRSEASEQGAGPDSPGDCLVKNQPQLR